VLNKHHVNRSVACSNVELKTSLTFREPIAWMRYNQRGAARRTQSEQRGVRVNVAQIGGGDVRERVRVLSIAMALQLCALEQAVDFSIGTAQLFDLCAHLGLGFAPAINGTDRSEGAAAEAACGGEKEGCRKRGRANSPPPHAVLGHLLNESDPLEYVGDVVHSPLLNAELSGGIVEIDDAAAGQASEELAG
jgi:hypothetical protein